MEQVLIILGLLAIFFKGFWITKKKYSRNVDSLNLANEFIGNFAKYVNSDCKDLETFAWLLKKSNKLQNQMGTYGILNFFKPPFQNYQINNYPAIINLLPEIRKLSNDYLWRKEVGQYIEVIQNLIVIYIGVLEDFAENKAKNLKNPIVWFREGTKSMLTVPFMCLNWFGIINGKLLERIISNSFFKLLSGFVALIGLLSAVDVVK